MIISQNNSKEYILNLIRVFSQSTKSEKHDGLCYYDVQRERTVSMDVGRVYPVDRLVGAFAALSPNNAERTTYIALDRCLTIIRSGADCTVPAYGHNKRKALRILSGYSHVTDELKAPKTRSFYHNTMNPDDSSHITIDGHIFSSCVGYPIKMVDATIRTPAQYDYLADAVRSASQYYSLSAPRFQAVVWLAWKRIHNIVYDPQLDLWHEFDLTFSGISV